MSATGRGFTLHQGDAPRCGAASSMTSRSGPTSYFVDTCDSLITPIIKRSTVPYGSRRGTVRWRYSGSSIDILARSQGATQAELPIIGLQDLPKVSECGLVLGLRHPLQVLHLPANSRQLIRSVDAEQ
jgi:hypothetical protein